MAEGKDKEAVEFRTASPHHKSPHQALFIPDTPELLSPISLEMLLHAIRKMQPNKAGLFTAASRLKITPKAWQNNFVKLIFKKGETTAISNYRPLALLNSIFKLWETILFLKLQEELNLSVMTLKSSST
jgi:hypothetical protein